MVKQKLMRRIGVGLAVGVLMTLAGGAARAQQAVVPGRSAGRVFLGMRRGDVWKILRSPRRHRSVRSSVLPAPHRPGGYAVDQWESGPRSVTILYRNARVVHVEVNSPQFSAPGGVSVATPFAVLRRRFPRMRVDQYLSTDVTGGREDSGAVLFYADDVRRGIAFTTGTQDDAVTYDELPRLKPDSLIVHLPGQRVLPVDADPHSLLKTERRSHDDYLPEIRDWFAGGPHQNIKKG